MLDTGSPVSDVPHFRKRTGPTESALSALLSGLLSEALVGERMAKAEIQVEKLAGNIVKEAHWHGERVAYAYMVSAIRNAAENAG